MSLLMHVFLQESSIPDRASWQKAIDSLNVSLILYPDLNPRTDSGFSPSKIQGHDSGFEIYSEPSENILVDHPDLKDTVGDRNWCITFRWGGDLKECACALGATLGLVKLGGAIAYYPDDALIYDMDQLQTELKGCLSSVS